MPEERKRHLLIVDDEADFRTTVRRHFGDLGYEVLEAADGLEALSLFQEDPRRFDLVLTDIQMPYMRGDELIRKLREIRPFLPIIGITGQPDWQDQLSTLDSGAYYFLDKPIHDWPIADRIVANAIHLHGYEEQLSEVRKREQRVARMVREYLLHHAGTPADLEGSRGLSLDVAVEPIEIAHPGGDFVEFFERLDDELGLYVADASGHNDIVACIMACLSSMILHRSHHRSRPVVGKLILIIDQALQALRQRGALEESRYLSFFMGSINFDTGELAYVNAGHPEAFLVRSRGKGAEPECIPLPSNCRCVGFPLPRELAMDRIDLLPGDCLFVYTDGACEMLEDGEDPKSGIRLLQQFVRGAFGGSAREMVERVAEELKARVGPRGFEDDTTLLAIQVGEKGR